MGAHGLLPPLGDSSVAFCNGGDGRLDMYIDPLTGINGVTVPEEAVGDSGLWSTFITVTPGAPNRTTVHELTHAIQYAYPHFTEPSYFWTMNAAGELVRLRGVSRERPRIRALVPAAYEPAALFPEHILCRQGEPSLPRGPG